MKMCFFAFHHVMTLPAPAFCPQNKQNNKKTQWKEICSFKQFSRSPVLQVQTELAGTDHLLLQEQHDSVRSGVDMEQADGPGVGKAVHHVPSLKNRGKSLLKDPWGWPGRDWLRCSQLSVCWTVLLWWDGKTLQYLVHHLRNIQGKHFLKRRNTKPLSFLEDYNSILSIYL